MKDKIQTITDRIQQIPDDVGHQVNYLEILCNLSWGAGELLPEAKANYNEKLAEVTEKIISEYDKKIPTSLLNNLVKARCGAEQRVVDTIERILSTINLQSQNLRTIISYRKTG